MGITRPYRRIVRPFSDGSYRRNSEFIRHPKYATAPEQYVRAFSVIQKDFIQLLDFIEPADQNMECYSYRTHELLMRTCIEIEANFQAIFSDNGTNNADLKNLNMRHYKLLEQTHRLSSYKVKLPVWHGSEIERIPFHNFKSGSIPDWYNSYNRSKHNRHSAFSAANFRAVVDAISALVVILSSQFNGVDFGRVVLVWSSGRNDGFSTAIVDYFRVSYPKNWPKDDRYDFEQLPDDTDPFQVHPLLSVKPKSVR